MVGPLSVKTNHLISNTQYVYYMSYSFLNCFCDRYCFVNKLVASCKFVTSNMG